MTTTTLAIAATIWRCSACYCLALTTEPCDKGCVCHGGAS